MLDPPFRNPQATVQTRSPQRARRGVLALVLCILALLTELQVAQTFSLSPGLGLARSSAQLWHSLPFRAFPRPVCRPRQVQWKKQTTTMILDRLDVLTAASIILASQSPRRVEILNEIVGLKVKPIPSTFEENLDKSKFTPATYVQETARQKALEVWNRLLEQGETPDLVIGGDTVVALEDKILEKPKDKADAERMLGELSGHTHSVFSGVALLYPGKDGAVAERLFTEQTRVTFAELSSPVIKAYVESGEPMDKAGGYGIFDVWGRRYGIQAAGGMFVSGINGCYYNVMGFPMHKFCREVAALLDEGALLSAAPRKASKTA